MAVDVAREIFMGSRLDNLSSLKEGNGVGVADGGEAMGYDDAGAASFSGVKGLLDDVLRLTVKCAGGLVEEQNLGRTNYGSCNGDPLLLPAR